MADGTPPCNIDAERSLLGAILFDNDAMGRLDNIRADHFYDPVHARIFAFLAETIAAGRLADLGTAKARFATDEGMAEVGGSNYLHELVEVGGPAVAAGAYALSIYESALRRELIRIGGEISQDAADPAQMTKAALQIEEAEGKLYALTHTGASSTGFVGLGAAIAQTVGMATTAHQRGDGLSGIPTHLIDLDQKLGGLHRSDLIVLAGRPGMGKTALATNIAFNIAKAYQFEMRGQERVTTEGGIVAFYSCEMSTEQLATRIVSDHIEVPSNRIRRGRISDLEEANIREAATALADVPIEIDDTGGLSIDALCGRARRMARTRGIDLIVIDYIQLLSGKKRRGDTNRVQEVTEITTSLKALAKELNVPIMALSQLNRGVEQRDNKRPMLADLRESGSIEQDADVVLMMYRDEYYLAMEEPEAGTPAYTGWRCDMDAASGMAECNIAKQRHGPSGVVKLQFNAGLTKFGNLAQAEPMFD